ncbi:MAG: flotillin family protein [Archangiaceae bacterium]|nr:flotillin family protein [Archangiaceae bacterium]
MEIMPPRVAQWPGELNRWHGDSNDEDRGAPARVRAVARGAAGAHELPTSRRRVPFMVVIALVGLLALLLFVSGIWVIREDESGLVIKKFGASLPPGRLVALNGEAGYQADLLSPGWYFGKWAWKYKVVKVPLLHVRPGELALVVAADGDAIPSERILGREIECDDYQNARAFLENGGEKGRQLAFLTAGTYRVNPALFEVITAETAASVGLHPTQLEIYDVPADRVGIVTVLDGRPTPPGDLAGPEVPGHDNFQRGQAFIDAGGCRGLQEQVLLAGAWNLNPWFVRVEMVPMTEIPIGYVGVVVSYVGREHLDLSGDDFTHGDLVEKGRKGVWVEPLLPGKHPVNVRVMKVELVPTTNIVLNWASRTEAHNYDAKLQQITVRSKDGFSFMLDVSQIIHIGMKSAPRVISRVGSMQNLVDHVLQPTVANYFRNSAQQVSVLEFLSARSVRQSEAYENIRSAIEAYDVECIDTLIGDIVPPGELMKTQTDRKIADELQRTFEVQREAQMKRQMLERETAVANMQAEVVRSEQMVRIAEKNALAAAETAKGQAARVKLEAEAEASATRAHAQANAEAMRLRGDAEAHATRAIGAAKAEAYRVGVEAMGEAEFTALQLAQTLGQHGVKLVPDVAVTGEAGQGALASALVGRMLLNGKVPTPIPLREVVKEKS